MKHNAARDILFKTGLVGLEMFMGRMQPTLYDGNYLQTLVFRPRH